MWGALAYSSTLFPPPSRRLANYNFFTWTLAYNLTLLAGALREGYKNLSTESVGKGGTPRPPVYGFFLSKKKLDGLVGYPTVCRLKSENFPPKSPFFT